ncbi:MAG: hypothetical protein GY870_15010 [archaeon]|nr:hypothetical protein [archaeon]
MSLLKRVNGIGIKKGATWGTAVEPGTLNGIYVKSHTPGVNEPNVFTNDEEFSHDMPTIQTIGTTPAVNGNLVMPFYYEGLEEIFASVFGIYTGVAVSTIVTHSFKFKPVFEGLFHTIAWDEGTEVKSIVSAVMNSLKISIDDAMVIESDYIGDRNEIQAGFTNPLALTYKSTGVDKFKLLETNIYINDHDGADFNPVTEKLCANNLNINFNRQFEGLPHCSGERYIHEPKELNSPIIDMTLNFPKKDTINKDFKGDFEAGTLKKVKVEMIGKLISGTDYYKCTIWFPLMRIKSAPAYDQESPIPTTVELEVLKAATSPTGMTEIVPYAQIINEIPVLTGYPTS